MPPRLTIAIPTLNRARLLRRALDSALAQTSPDIEIIVSDNGSTDETQAVIAGYAGRQVRSFCHPSTISAARHGRFLIEQASGEFFLGLSDDDFLEPEFGAEVLAQFDRHTELSFVYTGCVVHYEECQVPALVGPSVESGAAFLAGHYADKREVCWCACVTRVKDLRELAPPPEDRIIGDMYYWTKLAFRGPVGCVPQRLSHYVLLRSQNDNVSHGTPPCVWGTESRLLAEEVIEASRHAGASDSYLVGLQADSRRHVARSVANQFIWCRLRGASRLQAWKWLPKSLPHLCWNPTVLTRLLAGLLLPRTTLRDLLLRGARKLGNARANGLNRC